MNQGSLEELYKYSKDVLAQETQRSSRIDDKATKYLSIVTAILGLYALLGKQLFADIIPPNDIFQAIALFFATLLLASLVFSWSILFKIIKTRPIYLLTLSDETLTYYSKKNLYGEKGIYYEMAQKNKELVEKNKDRIDSKSMLLYKAYKAIVLTVILLLIFIISTVVNEWQQGL